MMSTEFNCDDTEFSGSIIRRFLYTNTHSILSHFQSLKRDWGMNGFNVTFVEK